MLKEKLTDKQFFLIINGPSCAGKSSVSDILTETYGNIYKGKSDAIKWLISDYTPDTHRGIVHLMTLETIRVALTQGLSAIKEGALWETEKYTEIAKSLDIPLFIANIEAPWEVLLSRFEARVETKRQGADKKIANTSPTRFKELYDMYHAAKMTTDMAYDSSKQTSQEIAEQISSYIRNH